MRLIFIVNEYAGNGKGKRIWPKLNEQLTIDFEVYFSQRLRHSEQLAREIAQTIFVEVQEHAWQVTKNIR